MQRDSMANTFAVALVLCGVCSLIVSASAVGLKPFQDKNKALDIQKNIIAAAGLSGDEALTAKRVDEIFKNIERKLVNLETGEYVEDGAESGKIKLDTYDSRRAAKDPTLNAPTKGAQFDIGISAREKYAFAYLVKDDKGTLTQVVLPIYGKGLWSTMYGFLALEKDLKTVKGLTFYEHGETPGLGGEIESAQFKNAWPGKKVYDGAVEDANIKFGVKKGSPEGDEKNYLVDGLSGATITSRGVDQLLKYWVSDSGFGKFLKKLSAEQGGSNVGA
jgi:Na+-transporting NADH:ubiquinone oxidoreductase subunit C